MTNSLDDVCRLALEYQIPAQDGILIDLNRQGVSTQLKSNRARFYFNFDENNKFHADNQLFFFSVPNNHKSKFFIKEDKTLNAYNIRLGESKGLTVDSCDTNYARREGTVFMINMQPKSSCNACGFCHTSLQPANDETSFSFEEIVKVSIENWLKQYKKTDLSYLHQVAVVTGCFGSERKTLDTMHLLRENFSEYNYDGEIFYLGSEIRSDQAVKELSDIKPFALCLSLECFENRNKVLSKMKSALSLERAKEIFALGKTKGLYTNFTYVLGLDSLDAFAEGMKDFLPVLNRYPVINIYHVHNSSQRALLDKQANDLRYYFDARILMEKTFENFEARPRPWENYRPLWYTKYGKETLQGLRVPLRI